MREQRRLAQPDGTSGGLTSSLRTKDLCAAQASVSVPSTLKCSSLVRPLHWAKPFTRSKNSLATSWLNSRRITHFHAEGIMAAALPKCVHDKDYGELDKATVTPHTGKSGGEPVISTDAHWKVIKELWHDTHFRRSDLAQISTRLRDP